MDSKKDGYTYTTISVNNFIIDYINSKITYDKDRSQYIFDLVSSSSLDKSECKLDSTTIPLALPDEQMLLLRKKQDELGYNSFAKFIKCIALDDIMNSHLPSNSIQTMKPQTKESPKLISLYKFETLTDRCYNALLHGKYTSYDINLLRDNKTYENDISLFEFNNAMKDRNFPGDFIEYDMLIFLFNNLTNRTTYDELEGLSTEQYTSEYFLKMEDSSQLKPFIDYDNIVPNRESYFYLWCFYTFAESFPDIDLGEAFNENREHTGFLLDRYTFDKIMKHYKDKYNINDYHKVFDEDCINKLKSSNIIGE